jgi:hypothetical protein
MCDGWLEYDSAAKWCAKRGNPGTLGHDLPVGISDQVLHLINCDPEAFEQRVKDTAYMLSMESQTTEDQVVDNGLFTVPHLGSLGGTENGTNTTRISHL